MKEKGCAAGAADAAGADAAVLASPAKGLLVDAGAEAAPNGEGEEAAPKADAADKATPNAGVDAAAGDQKPSNRFGTNRSWPR